MLKRITFVLLTLFCCKGHAEFHVDIEEAIQIALSNNQTKVVSSEQLEIAEAQYQQALSAYWPNIDLNAAWQRRDEDATFTLDEFTASTVTPFGPISIAVPETDVTLFDRDIGTYSLNLTYPLYTGGKRLAIRDQARAGVEIAKEAVVRNENQIRLDVKRYYHAVILTSLLHQITDDTYAALSVARDITKIFFENGSSSVDRRDLLQSEMALATFENTRANFVANHKSAMAALRFAMGLNWNEQVSIKSDRFKSIDADPQIEALVTQAEQTNPDISTLVLSVQAAEAGVQDARSGYLPKIAFVGSATSFQNSFGKGLVNDRNEDTWSIGIQMQIPLFRGFRTKNEVAVASHRKDMLSAQKILVDKAVSTQIHSHLIELGRAREMRQIGKKASNFATEHSQLTGIAYQNKIIETKEVIEAYIYESIIKSQEVTAFHDEALNIAQLEYLIGKEIANLY